MTEQPPLEAVESIDLSDQDEADIAALMREPDAEYHTILEVWKELLAPAEKAAQRKPTPFEAARIVTQYPQIKMQEMQLFHETFYDKIFQIRTILEDEIKLDEKCLLPADAIADRENNTGHYKNLLKDWQIQMLRWELDWDCTDEMSHIELAAMVEVHKMILSQEGIVSHLDSIALEFTEADREVVNSALEELRGEHE